ncbi:MAG: CRISPR-associated endonuclease Cas1, partial [Myxococcota bacterium]
MARSRGQSASTSPSPRVPTATVLSLAVTSTGDVGRMQVVPLRKLNAWTFCRRLGILEWVHGEFDDNQFTIEGTHHHRRVDWPGAPIEVVAGMAQPSPSEPLRTRSVYLESEREGLAARMDLVEIRDGEVIPVDTKRGRPPRPDEDPTGVWEADRVQLCGQALVLRDHGYRCDRGYIFYVAVRRRVEVDFDAALVARVRDLRSELVATAERGELPPPLVQSPKCRGCSLMPICLPDEVNLLRGLAAGTEPPVLEDVVVEPVARAEAEPPVVEADDEAVLAADEEVKPARPRRLLAPADERRPLYVTDARARIGVEKGLFVVSTDEGPSGTARVRDTSQVVVFGRAQVSTLALREAMDHGIPVVYFTAGGYFVGMALGQPHKNVVLREAQWRCALDGPRSLEVARAIVRGKIRNQRTLLRRNGEGVEAVQLREMAFLAERAERAERVDELLGLEGAAAAIYFRFFGSMLRPRDESGRLAFVVTDRNRRPPRDPVNALLSLVYALLARECAAAAQAAGFDPYMGFYHRPRYGKPALALDLMEEVRPLVADSVVLSVVNQGEVKPTDFVTRADGCNLTDGGRRAVLRAYERRLEQEIVHPIFGYKA